MNKPRKLEWIFMEEEIPTEERDIVFYSDMTEERIGIAVPSKKIVILRRTDLCFHDIDYWMYLPDEPMRIKRDKDKE